jgi:3-oxoacyl-[acyl-carrier protein] reductase
MITATSERIHDRAKELDAGGLQVLSFVADLTDEQQVEEFVHAVTNRLGRIDILVNNAGMARSGKQPGSGNLETLSFAEWQEQLSMTLNTAFLMTRAVLPVMKQQKYGRIVNVSSVTGPIVSNAGSGAYGAAKGALDGMMRAVAVACAGAGITINAVAPGWIATGSSLPQELEAGKHTPLGRPGRGGGGSEFPGVARSVVHYRAGCGCGWRKHFAGDEESLSGWPMNAWAAENPETSGRKPRFYHGLAARLKPCPPA